MCAGTTGPLTHPLTAPSQRWVKQRTVVLSKFILKLDIVKTRLSGISVSVTQRLLIYCREHSRITVVCSAEIQNNKAIVK